MYQLHVFHRGEAQPRRTMSVRRASEVLEKVPIALALSPECERIEVFCQSIRLFTVDAARQRASA
jgi:hypothetical protein